MIGGIAVAVLGLGIGAYFYLNADQKQTEPAAARAPQPLIRADVEKIIIYQSGESNFLKETIQKRLKVPQLSAYFSYLPIKEETAGRTKFLNGSEFFQAAKINIPLEIIFDSKSFRFSRESRGIQVPQPV